MIKKIKQTKLEKILLIFIIILAIITFGSLITMKNKCLFVKNYNPEKLKFKNSENIAILNAIHPIFPTTLATTECMPQDVALAYRVLGPWPSDEIWLTP